MPDITLAPGITYLVFTTVLKVRATISRLWKPHSSLPSPLVRDGDAEWQQGGRSVGPVLGPWQVVDIHLLLRPRMLPQHGVGLELLRIWRRGLQSLEGSEPRGGHQSLGENSPRLPNVGGRELGEGSKACIPC